MEKLQKIFLGIGIVLLILIPVWRFMIVPELEKMPSDYSLDLKFIEFSTDFDENGEPLPKHLVSSTRKDEVIEAEGNFLIIDTLLDIHELDGSLIFENRGKYRVDRETKQNSGEIDGVTRTGHFAFPLHVEKTTYEIWNPHYGDKGVATYKKEDTVRGLATYVFDFVASKINENEGYSFIEGVPEQYDALTDGRDTIWVEPVTGIVVKREEKGESDLYSKDGEKISSFHDWELFFNDDTIANQVRIAQNEKQKIILYETIVPILLAVIAAALFIASYIGGRKK